MPKHRHLRDPRTTKPHHRDAPFNAPQYDGVLVVDDGEDDVDAVLKDTGAIHSILDARRSRQW